MRGGRSLARRTEPPRRVLAAVSADRAEHRAAHASALRVVRAALRADHVVTSTLLHPYEGFPRRAAREGSSPLTRVGYRSRRHPERAAVLLVTTSWRGATGAVSSYLEPPEDPHGAPLLREPVLVDPDDEGAVERVAVAARVALSRAHRSGVGFASGGEVRAYTRTVADLLERPGGEELLAVVIARFDPSTFGWPVEPGTNGLGEAAASALADLASGAPLEWALRRAEAGGA